MSDSFHWACPYCNHDTTLRGQDFDFNDHDFSTQQSVVGYKKLQWLYIVCPNPQCHRYALKVDFYDLKVKRQGGFEIDKKVNSWRLIPQSSAKTFPSYIPKAILDDYNEACLIVDLSPKASATLCRRCIQGILRDFWKVKPGRLVDEINQINEKTDQETWDAIDSVRKIGNIGAHMEKDIDLMVDVDPREAETLIELIEILLKEWYVGREARKNSLNKIKAIADQKNSEREKEN